MNILKNNHNKKETKDRLREKLPFAVFVLPKNADNKYEDYKQVFTDIISERIKEKFN